MADEGTYGGSGANVTGHVVHGYVSGATVFADANHNGSYDAGEASAVTDALGQFFLKNAVGSLVSVGGVDTSTNQPITVTLEAPAGSTVITPLTTLVNLLLPSNPTSADITAAESAVIKGLGVSLSSGQSLLSLDPVAGTISGDAGATAAYLAGAKVYDTISILSAGLSSQGGVSLTAATHSVVAALADKLEAAAATGRTLDLNAPATLQDVLGSAATAAHATLNADASMGIGKIAAASNAALDDAAAGAKTGQDLFLATSAVQQVAEGATSSALLNHPAGQSLSDVVSQYTGANLDHAIDDASGSVSAPGTEAGEGRLLINLSGDQYYGNPEFKVYVDGKFVTGHLSEIGGSGAAADDSVSANHDQNQWQTFTVDGTYDTSVSHKVEVTFANDLYGGTSSTDRNLYVGNITLGGQAVTGTTNDHPAALLGSDTATRAFTTSAVGSTPPAATGTDTLAIHLSGDQYQGNPDFLVYVDGNLVTGQLTGINGSGTASQDGVSASHVQNQWQTYTVKGNFDPSVAHKIDVVFTNDVYGGTASTDRNLYVGKITLNGQPVGNSTDSAPTTLLGNGDQLFTSSPSTTGSGHSTVPGGTGSDTLSGGTGSGHSTVPGGTGSDTLSGGTGSGHSTVPGGTGSDTLSGGSSFSHSYNAGGPGNLYSGSAGDTLYGGLSAGAHDTLTGGSGNDLLLVKYGDNVLRAGAGLDTLQGGSGHDTLYGGGQSELYAGSGGDTLYGGLSASAHDTLNSGAGNDFLHVSQGNNLLFGGAGLDTLQGGSGHDTLYGGGQSAMFAGSGGDTLYGGLGNGAHDTLMGGAGNDLLSVIQGNNLLYASGGMDTLHAGSGNDTLYAGSGDAKLYGGSGHTTFEITGTTGNDTIIGGSGSSSVIIDGHSSADAHYRTNTDGSTTISFTGSSQSLRVSNIDTLHFSDDNHDHKLI